LYSVRANYQKAFDINRHEELFKVTKALETDGMIEDSCTICTAAAQVSSEHWLKYRQTMWHAASHQTSWWALGVTK